MAQAYQADRDARGLNKKKKNNVWGSVAQERKEERRKQRMDEFNKKGEDLDNEMDSYWSKREEKGGSRGWTSSTRKGKILTMRWTAIGPRERRKEEAEDGRVQQERGRS